MSLKKETDSFENKDPSSDSFENKNPSSSQIKQKNVQVILKYFY